MREAPHLSRRSIAAALPIAALIGTAAAAPTNDAALLDLGRQWQALHEAHVVHWRAWQALPPAEQERRDDELTAECEAMSFEEWALEERIRAIPASSIAGLAVKARIAAHEFDIDDLGEASIASALDAAQYSVDRATLALALDILRLARTAS